MIGRTGRPPRPVDEAKYGAARDVYKAAKRLVRLKQYTEAASVLERSLEIYPSYPAQLVNGKKLQKLAIELKGRTDGSSRKLRGQILLGLRNLEGISVLALLLKEQPWHEAAPLAAFHLARAYDTGVPYGVVQNHRKADVLFKLAANALIPEAMIHVAHSLRMQDTAERKRIYALYETAFRLGYLRASVYLAKMCETNGDIFAASRYFEMAIPYNKAAEADVARMKISFPEFVAHWGVLHLDRIGEFHWFPPSVRRNIRVWLMAAKRLQIPRDIALYICSFIASRRG